MNEYEYGTVYNIAYLASCLAALSQIPFGGTSDTLGTLCNTAPKGDKYLIWNG